MAHKINTHAYHSAKGNVKQLVAFLALILHSDSLIVCKHCKQSRYTPNDNTYT